MNTAFGRRLNETGMQMQMQKHSLAAGRPCSTGKKLCFSLKTSLNEPLYLRHPVMFDESGLSVMSCLIKPVCQADGSGAAHPG